MKVFTILLGLVASIVLFTLAYNEQSNSALIAGCILFTASAFLCYLVVINWIEEKHKPIMKAIDPAPYNDYGIEWVGTESWNVLAHKSNVIVHQGTLGECRAWIKAQTQ